MKKFSQDDISATIDFAAEAMHQLGHVDQDILKSVKAEHSDKDVEPNQHMEKLSPDEMKVLEQVRFMSKAMLPVGLEEFQGTHIDGFVARLERGKLGLVRCG